jgi:hypothetical protein
MNFTLYLCVIAQTAMIFAVWRIATRILKTMPTRADLDAALAALVSSFNDLSTALTALAAAIANLPPPGNPDFTDEIGQVQQAAASVAAAQQSVNDDIAALNPPPPPKPAA